MDENHANLTIPKELMAKAKDMGINVSFIARKALEREIKLHEMTTDTTGDIKVTP